MRNRFFLLFSGFIAWTFFFLVARALFLLYHSSLTGTLSVGDTLLVFANGIRMDFSMAGYFSLLPGLMFGVTFFCGRKTYMAVLVWVPGADITRSPAS